MKFGVSRQYIYRRKNRYDGTLESLCDRSGRPHSHPDMQTPKETALIKNMLRHNKNTGIVVLWVKLRRRGCRRSISALYKAMKRLGAVRIPLPDPKKYVPKPYEKMDYPGQRVQTDVKFVPKVCHVGEAEGKRFCQYTAIDRYSRFRCVEAFNEHSTYSSAVFLTHMLRFFKFKVECVRTDNGSEFTNRFTSDKGKLTLFEKYLDHYNFPMRPLGWKSPREVMMYALRSCVTDD